MNESFPDDVPLESKMVSKAVERAQGTVEDRNFEIRKNVLKYDEVMNEQRKIIYRRRQQILDGEDLERGRDPGDRVGDQPSRRAVLPAASSSRTGTCRACSTRRALYFPTRITKEQIDDVIGREALEATVRRRRQRRCTRRRPRRSAPRHSATSNAA